MGLITSPTVAESDGRSVLTPIEVIMIRKLQR